MSLDKPRPRMRSWGFSLCGLCVGIDALCVQVSVEVCAVIANAPPNADEGWPRVAVPPLCKFFDASKNAKFWVFWKEDSVVIVNVRHREILMLDWFRWLTVAYSYAEVYGTKLQKKELFQLFQRSKCHVIVCNLTR
jgi:hypothetical protein